MKENAAILPDIKHRPVAAGKNSPLSRKRCTVILNAVQVGKTPLELKLKPHRGNGNGTKPGKGHAMKETTKYTIESHWNGCTIRRETSGNKFPVWLARVYRGRAEWVTDYTYARHYTPAGAAGIVKRLQGGDLV